MGLMPADRLTWSQIEIEFVSWEEAEHIASIELLPVLERAESQGDLERWWYIRKRPRWKLRLQHASPSGDGILKGVLDNLAVRGHLHSQTRAIYEPETYAFGGTMGMTVAHSLFHEDSRGCLHYFASERSQPIGRRELSILLYSLLFRSAQQDYYEQGDIWKLVQQNRPAEAGLLPKQISDLAPALRALISADTRQVIASNDILRASVGPWADAIAERGAALVELAHHGGLTRGLRAVLAHHVLFHWNRIGLPYHTQSIIATAASNAIFHPSTAKAAVGEPTI